MENLKEVLKTSFCAILAYLSPINDILFAVTIAFVLNFLTGYIASMCCDGESFRLKKAFKCIQDICVYAVIIAAIYTIGDHLSNSSEALTSISIITYVLLYFYSCNIFKNLRRLYPKSQWISFCYWAISFEYVKKVPFLESFLKHKNKDCADANQSEKAGF